VIWLYAICDRPELAPPAGLDALGEAGLTAVFTRHGPEQPTPDALWAHERVVEQLMADRAVLPMRFGSKLEDDASLRALLVEHRERFTRALAHVAGRVELGVRALQPTMAETAPAAPTGHAYLMGKLQENHRAAELHAPLEALSADVRRHAPRGGEELLRGAYLVDERAVEAFRGVVERLQLSHPDTAILCTGPWPPYSFVN
jgi:hypothetical protein